MKTTILLVMICFSSLCGCTSVIPFVPITIKRDFNTYNIGKEQSANVGSIMIEQGTLSTFPKFIAGIDYENNQNEKYPLTIKKGTIWLCQARMVSGYLFCWPEIKPPVLQPGQFIGIILSEDGTTLIGAGYYEVFEIKYIYVHSEVIAPPLNIFKETGYGISDDKNNFKMELIYNGKSQNVIKIGYREFTDNYARPAFYQDLTYDISESKDISFRNIKIEIIEATNNYIKFIVKDSVQ